MVRLRHQENLNEDDYYFGLDHFHHMVEKACQHHCDVCPPPDDLPPIDAEMAAQLMRWRAALEDPPVIDAKHMGGVGRFINHGHGGQENLAIQVVFTDRIHSLVYYRCRSRHFLLCAA